MAKSGGVLEVPEKVEPGGVGSIRPIEGDIPGLVEIDGQAYWSGEKLCQQCRRSKVIAVCRHTPSVAEKVKDPGNKQQNIYVDMQWVVPPTCDPCRWQKAMGGLALAPVPMPISDREVVASQADRFAIVGGAVYELMSKVLRDLAETMPLGAVNPPFPTGIVKRTQAVLAALGPYDFMALLHRHRAGDFGDYGLAADAARGNAASYCPELFGVATANVAARDSGRGFVRSSYTVQVPNRPLTVIRINTYYRDSVEPQTVIISTVQNGAGVQ